MGGGGNSLLPARQWSAWHSGFPAWPIRMGGVEIDVVEARMWLRLAVAVIPRPVMHADIGDLVERQAVPITSDRFALLVGAGKLPGQHAGGAVLSPEHDRADLAPGTMMGADERLAGQDGACHEIIEVVGDRQCQVPLPRYWPGAGYNLGWAKLFPPR